MLTFVLLERKSSEIKIITYEMKLTHLKLNLTKKNYIFQESLLIHNVVGSKLLHFFIIKSIFY